MYYLDFGDFQIAGASPEPLLRVTGRRVETYPVAGTRRRTGDPADDAELAAELLADEKERAEHIMLVDLARNDLGRVSEYGSVVVDELMKIDTFSHLLHISSLVSGTLADGVRAIDALRSTLPAGTLSGAPKVRAMEIIEEVEPVKRSWYAARSASSPTAAIWTPASTSAPWSSRTAWCTRRRAVAPSPMRSPPMSTRSR